MTQFLTGAPIWVGPLLALLIFVGLRARQARSVPVLLIYLLPLLGILSLRAVASLPAGNWIWMIFLVLYGAGLWAGHRLQARWVLGRTGRMVQLAGENLTLLLMMAVFWANFLGGVLLAVAPDIYGNAMFQTGFTALLALAAGIFAGRALFVWRAG